MGIEAFVLRYDFQGVPFASEFLKSPDFDAECLRPLVESWGIRANSKKKGELIDLVLRQVNVKDLNALPLELMKCLVSRRKDWASVKLGRVNKFPTLEHPGKLVLNAGEPRWYGPLHDGTGDPAIRWYVRPTFLPHLEYSEQDGVSHKFQVRWLCFARVKKDSISLHWRGFTIANAQSASGIEDSTGKNTQFSYWNYIPRLFKEIEELTDAHVHHVHLHRLVLHDLWDRYLPNPDYKWTHRRIRAESDGISFNAHAGAVVEKGAEGIVKLARVIREAVQQDLSSKFRQDLPDAISFDHTILRTLIREYGTLSYEFSLEKDGSPVFRAHSYFGLKENSDSADCFPHLRFFFTFGSDIEQIEFLLQHFKDHSHNENSEPQTLRLF